MRANANGLHPNHSLSQRVTKSEPCLFPADLPTQPEPEPPPKP
jgi:hypothetical protein